MNKDTEEQKHSETMFRIPIIIGRRLGVLLAYVKYNI
jgi:hypothetical protein